MPLHLLGKKSWNIYNPDNIARVRRDEAAAKAKEADNERLKRQKAAQDRLDQLRNSHELSSLEVRNNDDVDAAEGDRPLRKRRRLAGENDTDRDLRLAKEDTDRVLHDSIYDKIGHINLIPGQNSASHKDHQHAGLRYEDGVRLEDALGRDRNSKAPWYSTRQDNGPKRHEAIARNVWGDDDPRRREREQQRLAANDPLLAMKKGVKQLRENEKQRQDWISQRELDLAEIEELPTKHRKRRRSNDSNSLDGFSLDAQAARERVHRKSKSRHGERSGPDFRQRYSREHKHKHRDRRKSHREK